MRRRIASFVDRDRVAANHAAGRKFRNERRVDRRISRRSERLILRRWRDDDAEAWAALNSDSEVIAWLGRRSPMTPAEARDDIHRFDAHFDAHGFGPWVVETRAGGALIGPCGLRRVLADDHPMTPCVEIAWRQARFAWRRGYMPDVAHAALIDGFDRIQPSEVFPWTAAANLPSVAKHPVQDRHAANGFARFRSSRACGRASAAPTRRLFDSAASVALIELRRVSTFACGAPIVAACDIRDPRAREPREAHHTLNATARPRETAPCCRSRHRARAMQARA
ncbi:GNAT family N-acetyltransferase [Burkholderia mayonis]|uniref:GNAT family N-acetyltransferase n=1 Tax=Burkholderia mayonis TaxID=1385591 RepID=UPI001CF7C330|nr:GNAT family N-acetyltransferase [Burkholderia mayonis]